MEIEIKKEIDNGEYETGCRSEETMALANDPTESFGLCILPDIKEENQNDWHNPLSPNKDLSQTVEKEFIDEAPNRLDPPPPCDGIKAEIKVEPSLEELLKLTKACVVKLVDIARGNINMPALDSEKRMHAPNHKRTNAKKRPIRGRTERGFTCAICWKRLYKKVDLQDHINSHTREKTYGCKQCPKKYAQRRSLLNHNEIHCVAPKYLCSTCGHQFYRRSQLRQHLKSHGFEKPYRCDVCHKCFANRTNIRIHIESVHFKESKHFCQDCSKGYWFKRTMKLCPCAGNWERTGRDVTIKLEKPRRCDFCQKNFSNVIKFRRHFMKRHINICSTTKDTKNGKPLPCRFCGMTFLYVVNLWSHVRNHVFRNTCKYCEQTFPTAAYLQVHLRRHAICRCCDKYFPTFTALNRHKEISHVAASMTAHSQTLDIFKYIGL